MSNVVKYLHSALTGAPALSGQAGAMVSLLNAVLTDGFGSVTLDSLVISGGIATATRSAGHPFEVDSIALIAGATVSGGSINGEVKVLTVPSANVFTFDATGISNQTAGGTITAKFAPLGWNNAPVTAGTNVVAYKSSNGLASGMILRVDDTGTTSARVVGYEAMTDINTGSGPFPTAAQLSGGGYWPKSSTADSTARQWVLVGDDKTFYLWMTPTNAALTTGLTVGFGDFASRKSSDAYCAFINYSSSTAATGGSGASTYDVFFSCSNANSTLADGFYLPRAISGVGSAIKSTRHASSPISDPTNSGMSGTPNGTLALTYPNPADNALVVSPIMVADMTSVSIGAWRGSLRGIYFIPHNGPIAGGLAHKDKVSSTVGLTGRKLVILGLPSSACGAIDFTGPWA
jgi:hypothetical protein